MTMYAYELYNLITCFQRHNLLLIILRECIYYITVKIERKYFEGSMNKMNEELSDDYIKCGGQRPHDPDRCPEGQQEIMEADFTEKCKLIWQNLKIMAIRKYPNFVRLDVCHSRHHALDSTSAIRNISAGQIKQQKGNQNSEQSQVLKQLQKVMPEFLQKYSGDRILQTEEHFVSCCQKIKNQKQCLMYIPILECGPKISTVVLSDGLLKQIGYDPQDQEEILSIQKFRLFAFNLINDQTFKNGFACYLKNLLMYMRDFLATGNNNQSAYCRDATYSNNNFHGKMDVEAKIKISAVSPFVISYQIVEILKKTAIEDENLLAKRNQIIQISLKRSKKIIKMYEQNIKKQKSNVCGYVKIQKRGKRLQKNQQDSNYQQPFSKRGSIRK